MCHTKIIFTLLFFGFAFAQCGSEQANNVYYLNVIDAPPEVHQYIEKQLIINDKFVQLIDNDKIIPSKEQGEKKIDKAAPIVYFKYYDAANVTNYNAYANNYRMDTRFQYDSLGAMRAMQLHIEKNEKGYWHSYSDSGILPLNLDAKQSRLNAKKQQKIVLERIVANIKKIAFK
jgi:hypothetical protein